MMPITMPGTVINPPGPASDPGLRLLVLTGDDTTAFLDAQSMTPLQDCEPGRVVTCGFANNKGRVLALATAWHREGNWYLLLPGDQVEWFAAHLLRFRFRSRVSIETPPGCTVYAMIGESARSLLQASWRVPEPGNVREQDTVNLLSLPGARYLMVSVQQTGANSTACARNTGLSSDPAEWQGACILAGEATVYAATRARFLPQSLNLDHTGVIGWHKGCYPGQEVITRLQHRGTVKRRLLPLMVHSDASIGERTVVSGVAVEIVNRGRLADGRPVTQVIAPYPFEAGLETLRPNVAATEAGAGPRRMPS